MRKKVINFDDVRNIALGLPGVKEDAAFGGRAFKVDGKLLACTPTNRSAEPGSLGVRIDVNDRALLLAEAPDVYYVTAHYVPYPMVLVRLSRVTPDMLRDLLRMAHKFVTANSKTRRRSSAATRS
ncbi:MAG: MmcQ/YjbR family DNA-binding protein [Candidatus Acidiferrales bacterium]